MLFTCDIEITHERGTRDADWADWREAAVLHKLTSHPSSARVRRTYSYHPQTTETVQENLYGGPKTALRSGMRRKKSNSKKRIQPVARRQLPDFWAFFVVTNVLKMHTWYLKNEYVGRGRGKWAWHVSYGRIFMASRISRKRQEVSTLVVSIGYRKIWVPKNVLTNLVIGRSAPQIRILFGQPAFYFLYQFLPCQM